MLAGLRRRTRHPSVRRPAAFGVAARGAEASRRVRGAGGGLEVAVDDRRGQAVQIAHRARDARRERQLVLPPRERVAARWAEHLPNEGL